MRGLKWLYEGPASYGVAMTAASIEGAKTLILGMLGDGYPLSEIGLGFEADSIPVTSVGLGRRELSFGIGERFLSALERQDELAQDSVIIVAESGAASMLKEDTSLILEGFKSKNRNRVILSKAHPIRDLEYKAAEKTLLQLGQELAAPAQRSKNPSVNIIGPSLLGINSKGDMRAMGEIIGSFGIEVNAVLPLGATLHDFATLPKAWANVTTSPEISVGLLSFLEKEFSQPYVSDLPIGFEGTRRFARGLGEILGFESRVDTHKADFKPRADFRVALVAPPELAEGLAKFLSEELGLKGVLASTFLKGYRDRFAEGLAASGVKTITTDDSDIIKGEIESFEPDLILGTYNESMVAEETHAAASIISAPADRFHFAQANISLLGTKGAERILGLLTRAGA